MSTAPTRRLSPQEYLALERQAEFKSEYLRGEVFAMAGATYEHTVIKDNLARKAGNQLENGPCRALTSDMRVKVNATGLYTYPDIAIVCDQPQFEDEVVDTLLNPRAVVEVLSDSTEKYDRGAKFGHYRQIPLHFRRLREPAPPKMVVPSFSPREQSLVIRLVKALYGAGLGDLGRLHLAVVRPFAERVVDEACENEAIALRDRAAIIDTILKEALRGSID